MAALRKLIKLQLIEQQEPGFLNYVYNKEWVVYAKSPFGGAKQVIAYLGRYTHKIAISNHRIQKVDLKGVQFAYKDYADKNKTKSMTLDGEEFLRRFSQHILPNEKERFLTNIRNQTQESNTKKCLDKYFVSDVSIDSENEKFFLIKEIESIVKY